ncbi:hypothetical protein [Yoonia algicola]|uniref:Uncharacterized protein n=1 Tax=Yoonia algicola TaxID=3137368 RepID=A0AAN0NJL3_9RHOB
MKLYDVASLWVGPELTWMEQMCLLSFVDKGHRTILYVYDDVKSVPDGVEVRDANEIMPSDQIIYHAATGSPAFHSDIFRLRMLDQTDYLWIDTDAYCWQPFVRPAHGHFYGWGTDETRKIYSGVLGLPKDSPTLQAMLELTKDEYPVPPFLPQRQQRRLQSQKDAGDGVHISLMRWGVCGPDALHYFLHQSGEVKHAFDGPVLYPVPFNSTRSFHRPKLKKGVFDLITEETLSVHFYGRRFRNIFALTDGIPMAGSFADDLCQKHGLDPSLTGHLFVRRKKNG